MADCVSSAWVYAPGISEDRVILYFHGGAYYSGSIVTHREFSARMVKAIGMRLLLVDYRLAPEHPHPAAAEDEIFAYHWLVAEGFDPSRIIIAGDSAGGGLALALMLALKDARDPLPVKAFCFLPWTDLTLSGESIITNAKIELMCKPEFLRNSAQMYARGSDLKSPLILPLFADLRNLPLLLIFVGAEETLLDDSTRLATRAKAAGVDITLKIWPGKFHVFPLGGYMPEAKKALRMILQFVSSQDEL